MGQRLENFTAGVACPCADSASFVKKIDAVLDSWWFVYERTNLKT
jgi:hypothetical protein